jgi:tetratricopeptide (TPR) repeat protein
MLLHWSLYALAVDGTAAPFFSTSTIAILAVLGAIGAAGVWLLVGGDSGPGVLLPRGVRLAVAGRYAEAEKCYRKALADETQLTPALRASLLVALGNALMDLDRHEESQQYLESALAMDDPKGECRGALADALLLRGADPQRALNLAEEAIEACKEELGDPDSPDTAGVRLAGIVSGGQWARRAWTLALLGRPTDCQESVDYALKLVNPALEGQALIVNYKVPATTAASLCLAGVHWRAAEALLATGQADAAREHFGIASDLDPQGKCGARSRQHLERLRTAAG